MSRYEVQFKTSGNVDIQELQALEREAWTEYKSDVRNGVNSHDSFCAWLNFKEQLQKLGIETDRGEA
jgi:hypothetical protein